MITPQERRELLEKLEENRRTLLEEIAPKSETELERRHKEGDRTFKAMLLHVAEAEQSYINNWARRARDEDEPDVGRPSSGEAAMYEEGNELTVAELLERMRASREHTLQFIAATSDAEFDRIARNTPFGDLSVHQFLKSLYRHDQMHIDEIRGQQSKYVVTTTDGRRL